MPADINFLNQMEQNPVGLSRSIRNRIGLIALAVASIPIPISAQEISGTAQFNTDEPIVPNDMIQARRAAASEDSAEALARFLRVLAAEPRNLEALTGAGRAALKIGDANAAVSFYARAEEISPDNGRIKAGLGSAMTALMQPKPALKLFEEAINRGVPLADIAADRGLAYDLRGDNKRARADYELSLAAHPDPETTRRLALSIAIDGDPLTAMAKLDPLLRKQDKAAWRARAFILAISGDVAAAEKLATAMLLKPQAEALLPFLQRMPKLRASQQAAAVHFGQFPSEGKTYSETELLAASGIESTPLLSTTLTTRRDERGSGDEIDDAPSLKGKRAKSSKSLPLAKKPDLLLAATETAPTVVPPEKTARKKIKGSAPVETNSSVAAPLASTFDIRTVPVAATPAPAPVPAPEKPIKLAEASAPPAAKPAIEPSAAPKKETKLPEKTPAPSKTKTEEKEKKPVDPKLAAKDPSIDKKKAEKTKAEKAKEAKESLAEAKTKSKEAAAAKAKSAGKEQQRYWVQVATGAYKPDLGKAWGNLKTKYPAILGRYQPWTTPLNRTNRLMIGPFKTSAEAQGFVNKSAGGGFMTSPVTTPAGQSVERVN